MCKIFGDQTTRIYPVFCDMVEDATRQESRKNTRLQVYKSDIAHYLHVHEREKLRVCMKIVTLLHPKYTLVYRDRQMYSSAG